MKLNWNFLRGQGVQNKKPSVGSGTAHFNSMISPTSAGLHLLSEVRNRKRLMRGLQLLSCNVFMFQYTDYAP